MECDPKAARRVQSAFMLGKRRVSLALGYWLGENKTLDQACRRVTPHGASCVQKSDDSRFCNSHCLSHFAAFFIVVGTKTSTVENLVLVVELS